MVSVAVLVGSLFFFFQAEDGIRDVAVTGVQTCALPIFEFKQIIGRGTRLYDGKDYFTIYDFVKAHHHFNDPEWDGEPLEPEPREPRPAPRPGEPVPPPGPDPEPAPPRPRVNVKLADGKAR